MTGRFRGTFVAALVLVLVVVAAVSSGLWDEPTATYEAEQQLFAFEKEQLTGIRIQRPDVTIVLTQEDGVWQLEGKPWRPSRTMVRRVAHQIHDLTSRATVAEGGDLARFGLGDGAIEVTLTLDDGRSVAFQVGDPNPTSVSWYIRPLPGERVYVVKKAAIDYYRMSLEQFREPKFAVFDANDANLVDARVDGRHLRFERSGERSWQMKAPVEQSAEREEVRMMMGRIAALKAFDYVADQPADRSRWGPWEQRIRIGLASGEHITVELGGPVPDTEPPQRYAYRVEDDVVYAVRAGLLEAFRKPVEAYRNHVLIVEHEWDVRRMDVVLGGASLTLDRTADSWRWPDGSPIPGATPRRVAERAADVRATAFHDDGPPAPGFGPERARVVLHFDDGKTELVLGRAPLMRIEGSPTVYEIEDGLFEVIGDLHREHGRKAARDAEKNLPQ